MVKSMLISLFALIVSAGDIYAESSLMNQEIGLVSSVGPVSVANLNLNRQGNTIVARSGEKIFSTLNFACESLTPDAHTLYQIVIGYENMGPQKCIFNEWAYRCQGKEGILSFFYEAPEEPGIYEVQCNISSASSSAEALLSWWDQSAEDIETKVTVGRVIVK